MRPADLPFHTHAGTCPVQQTGKVDDCQCGGRRMLIRDWQLARAAGRFGPCFACGATYGSSFEYATHTCPAAGRPGSPPPERILKQRDDESLREFERRAIDALIAREETP